MKAKLNIRAIVLAEKLLGKPFGKFDMSNEEDAMAVTYGMVAANNEETLTRAMFGKILENKKIRTELTRQVKREFDYIGQFGTDEQTEGETDTSITDIAVMMIMAGMDANFVYDLRTTDIADFLKGIDAKKKEQMESDRFWTYLKILPHVDGKKMKGPENLITFPWEAEQKKKQTEEEFERGKAIFEKFIKSNNG